MRALRCSTGCQLLYVDQYCVHTVLLAQARLQALVGAVQARALVQRVSAAAVPSARAAAVEEAESLDAESPEAAARLNFQRGSVHKVCAVRRLSRVEHGSVQRLHSAPKLAELHVQAAYQGTRGCRSCAGCWTSSAAGRMKMRS